jgi:putative ABC transport system substrate-binding protein
LSGKRLELLRETVPKVGRVAMLWNSTTPSMVFRARETQTAADKLGVVLQSFGVHELNDFDQVFAAMTRQHPDAVLTLVDPFTTAYRQRIVDFAAAQCLVAVYEVRQFVEAGGLMSYGPSLAATQQRAALFIDKILKGAKPADLPVEQPTKFELVINLKTAKACSICF